MTLQGEKFRRSRSSVGEVSRNGGGGSGREMAQGRYLTRSEVESVGPCTTRPRRCLLVARVVGNAVATPARFRLGRDAQNRIVRTQQAGNEDSVSMRSRGTG